MWKKMTKIEPVMLRKYLLNKNYFFGVYFEARLAGAV